MILRYLCLDVRYVEVIYKRKHGNALKGIYHFITTTTAKCSSCCCSCRCSFSRPSPVPVALALTTIHAPAHCAERSTNRICIPSAIRIVVALDGGIKAQRTFAVMPFVEKCVHAHTSMDVMTVIPWRRCGCAEVEIWIAGGAM